MLPPPRRIISGTAARVVRTAAIRVRAIEASQSSSVTLAKPSGRGVTAPALLTRMSTPPSVRAASTRAIGPAGPERSTATKTTRPVGFQGGQVRTGGAGAGDDGDPFGDEGSGHREADALAGPGDHRDLVLQVQLHRRSGPFVITSVGPAASFPRVEPGHRHQRVARAASRMRSVTSFGLEIIDRCDALTLTVCARARSAIAACSAAGSTRSLVPTNAQVGIARQAGGPDGVARALEGDRTLRGGQHRGGVPR